MTDNETIKLAKELFDKLREKKKTSIDMVEHLILKKIDDEGVREKIRLAFIHLTNSETRGGVKDVFESAEKEIIAALSD